MEDEEEQRRAVAPPPHRGGSGQLHVGASCSLLLSEIQNSADGAVERPERMHAPHALCGVFVLRETSRRWAPESVRAQPGSGA